MADGLVQVPPDSSGKKIDTSELTVGANTVERERMVVGDDTAATGLAPVTSSAGLRVNLSSGIVTLSSIIGLSSGTVTLSSAPLVVAASSGWLVYSLSSGTVTLSSSPLVVVATSGGLFAIASTGVAVTSGIITLSSAIGISSGTVGVSSGTVTLSSNPTIISASSGVVATIASTSQTNTAFFFNASSSNSITNISTNPAILYGWSLANKNALGFSLKFFNTSNPTIGSTTNLVTLALLPGSTAMSGNNLYLRQGVPFATGITLAVTANPGATDTGLGQSAGDVAGGVYYI